MSKLTKFGRIKPTIPAWMLRDRPDKANVDPLAVTYLCDVCGVVEPQHWSNGYVRRPCMCEQRERETEERAVVQKSIRDQKTRVRAIRSYTWLGPDAEEPGLEVKTFGNFDSSTQPAAYRTCQDAARRIIDSSPQHNILLFGSVGTGKTHLAAAMVNACRTAGVVALFSSTQVLFDALYAADFDHKQRLLAQAGSAAVLILDDMDKLYIPRNNREEATYQQSMLGDIIDRRYKRRLPTIVTANTADLSPWLSEAALDRFDSPVIVLRMDGTSYRRRR